MSAIQFLLSLFILILSLLFIYFTLKKHESSNKSNSTLIPKSYPLIGSSFAIKANSDRRVQWTSDILQTLSSPTFVLHRPMGSRQIFTADPDNVQHILKTHFHLYGKGPVSRHTLFDFLGNGIFNADGDTWKFQRQVASHEFSTKSLRKFVETVVDTEINERLVPILAEAAVSGTVLDFQDVLQRFAFDNVCKIAFGYDPAYLSPGLPPAPFAEAFEESVMIISDRFNRAFPIIWKIKKILGIGSEKRLKETMSQVRDFAMKMVQDKKQELIETNSRTDDSVDLLSRFLNSGISDETFVTDVVISFILAGRDTTSAALTWFFWLIFRNPNIETNILQEIQEINNLEENIFEEAKHMMYTHASLCETMRLYPPVPVDSKTAKGDDVWPDGTPVRKGDRVTYHPYAMGRLEKLWGADWADFKPERWLRQEDEKRSFVGRDPFSYPVFQAGPRVCLGKEMAFLQMKRVVAGVLSRFKIVPADGHEFEPVFIAYLTNKMKGGFPVRVEERNKN
ncbi:cytochrome P450 94A2-like [Mercurialis annua]|uniref:cytochrome P450 94A2-like n=1 Tax=Mercurialis annua TaxID=3986 RepID=UPI00215E1AB7|nr:cytochrome P450 94A2-like [Mercurialis annua]